MSGRHLRQVVLLGVRRMKAVKTVAFSPKYLLCTNITISAGLSCVGDYIQQRFDIMKKELGCWNRERTGHVAIAGCLIGFFCHYWYIFLDGWLPGKTAKIILKKVIVDQIICSTIVIGGYLTVTSLLEGKRGKELQTEVTEKGLTLYTAEWIVWPPAQILNFYLLPTKYRVLYDNTISFGFDWYFAHVKYGKRVQKVMT